MTAVFTSCRRDAHGIATTRKSVRVCACFLSETWARGRAAALAPKTEVEFRPGYVYCAYTGLQLAEGVNLVRLVVRADPEYWKQTLLQVSHYDLSDARELLVHFEVRTEATFRKGVPMFEIFLLGNADIGVQKGAEQMATPGRTYKETRDIPTLPQDRPQPAAVVASAGGAKELRAWLSSEASSGQVVAPDAPMRLPTAEPPSEAVAEVDLTSFLDEPK
jgi:hypothetical protein